MSEIDIQLQDMRMAHRSFARYIVYLKPANFVKGRTVIETGLVYDAATQMREDMNKTLGDRGFGDPMYCVEMESIDNDVARPFWHSIGHGLTHSAVPVRDLDAWVAIDTVLPGYVCQVLWRRRGEGAFQTANVPSRPDAAQLARAKLAEFGDELYDLCITPMQAIHHTELAPRQSTPIAKVLPESSP